MSNYVNINGKGSFVLKVNSVEAARLSFDENTRDTLSFDLAKYIAANPNTFKAGASLTFNLAIEDYTPVSGNEDFKVTYSMEAAYYSSLPDSADTQIDFKVEQKFLKNTLGMGI